jgi:hypothetical protein
MTFSFGSQSIVKVLPEPGVIRIAFLLVETTPAAIRSDNLASCAEATLDAALPSRPVTL